MQLQRLVLFLVPHRGWIKGIAIGSSLQTFLIFCSCCDRRLKLAQERFNATRINLRANKPLKNASTSLDGGGAGRNRSHSRKRRIYLQQVVGQEGVMNASRQTGESADTLRRYRKASPFNECIRENKTRVTGGGAKPILSREEECALVETI